MALPQNAPESQVHHCGWTDPRDRVNWHIRSFRDVTGAWMMAFRASGQSDEHLTKNRFETSCDRLEDHELAALLDLARKSPPG